MLLLNSYDFEQEFIVRMQSKSDIDPPPDDQHPFLPFFSSLSCTFFLARIANSSLVCLFTGYYSSYPVHDNKDGFNEKVKQDKKRKEKRVRE